MQSTEWRPVPGYEGHIEVSNFGELRRLAHTDYRGYRMPAKSLRPSKVTSGHFQVRLVDRAGVRLRHMVHALVLITFVGPRPDGMQGCHNDGDPGNNWIGNLRWDTPSSNMVDRVEHGNDPQSNRVACPRGHALVSPNLTERHAVAGKRMCWACDRERSEAKQEGRDFSAESADRWFLRIIGGWKPVPMSERSCCPRGHALGGPNLRRAAFEKRGQRSCRACGIEALRAKRAGRDFSVDSADSIFRKLTAGN